MQKLLIYLISFANLLTVGCSTVGDITSAVPRSLGNTRLMYKPDIQQGNVLQQRDIDRLQPGMSKNQVQFIMGTPILVDLFHLERWDYLYLLHRQGKAPQQERVTLFFDDNRLVRIDRDLNPHPITEEFIEEEEGAVYSVPDYVDKERGLITRVLEIFKIKSRNN